MEVKKVLNGNELTIDIKGRVDTTTAPQLEAEIKESISGVKMLTLNFKDVEYVSSAGLRVLLATQKVMNNQGEMVLINVDDMIKEVFDITGFSDILTIK